MGFYISCAGICNSGLKYRMRLNNEWVLVCTYMSWVLSTASKGGRLFRREWRSVFGKGLTFSLLLANNGQVILPVTNLGWLDGQQNGARSSIFVQMRIWSHMLSTRFLYYFAEFSAASSERWCDSEVPHGTNSRVSSSSSAQNRELVQHYVRRRLLDLSRICWPTPTLLTAT
jgi:hypothetical protein